MKCLQNIPASLNSRIKNSHISSQYMHKLIARRSNSDSGSKLGQTPSSSTDILDEKLLKTVFVDHLKLNKGNPVLLEYLYDFNNTSYILNKLLNPKTHILQSPYRQVKTYLTKLSGQSFSEIHMVQTMRWTTTNMIADNLLTNSQSFFHKFNNLKLFLGSTPITFHRINNEFKTLIIGNYFHFNILPKLDLLIASKKFNENTDFRFDSPIVEMEDVDNIIEIYNLSGIDEIKFSTKNGSSVSEKNTFYGNTVLKSLYARATNSDSDDAFEHKLNKDPKPKYFFIDCLTSMKLLQKENQLSQASSNLKYRSKFTMKMQTVFDINPVATFISQHCTYADKTKKTNLTSQSYKEYLQQAYPETQIFDGLSKEQMVSPDFEKKGALTLFEIKIKPEILALSQVQSSQLHDFLDCISNKPAKSIASNLKFVQTDEMYKYLKDHADWELLSNTTCLDATQEQLWSVFEVYKSAVKYSDEMNDNYEDL